MMMRSCRTPPTLLRLRFLCLLLLLQNLLLSSDALKSASRATHVPAEFPGKDVATSYRGRSYLSARLPWLARAVLARDSASVTSSLDVDNKFKNLVDEMKILLGEEDDDSNFELPPSKKQKRRVEFASLDAIARS
ncbi:hypothetical protein KSP40_PGU001824 [Platanthera guangdongensis]|uniref:Uncharacterized protein n=1 Tax=Platanthera guangdongensis TaxID=2320717 RepID=A0ABR2MUD0_9ASPA